MSSYQQLYFPNLKETIEKFVRHPWSRAWRPQIEVSNEEDPIYTKDFFPKDYNSLVLWINKRRVVGLHLLSYRENVLMQSELVIDVDLTDFKEVREYCGCSSAKICCQTCWSVAMFGARIIRYFLMDLLLFEKVHFFFSGCRGVHIYILDDRAVKMDVTERKQLLDFMAFPFITYQHLQHSKKYPHLNEIVEMFDVEELARKHFPKLKTTRYQLFQMFWPRFDSKVTTAFRTHPHRLPQALRYESDLTGLEFDANSTFDPHD